MLDNNEVIYQQVSPVFPEVLIDTEAVLLYFFAPTEELGNVRINFKTSALSKGFDFVALPNDKSGIQAKIEFDIEAGMAAVTKLEALSSAWVDLWPKLLKEFVKVRAEYGRVDPITKENSEFTILAPGEEPNDSADIWWLELQLKPWDGFWEIRFDLNGEQMEGMADF